MPREMARLGNGGHARNICAASHTNSLPSSCQNGRHCSRFTRPHGWSRAAAWLSPCRLSPWPHSGHRSLPAETGPVLPAPGRLWGQRHNAAFVSGRRGHGGPAAHSRALASAVRNLLIWGFGAPELVLAIAADPCGAGAVFPACPRSPCSAQRAGAAVWGRLCRGAFGCWIRLCHPPPCLSPVWDVSAWSGPQTAPSCPHLLMAAAVGAACSRNAAVLQMGTAGHWDDGEDLRCTDREQKWSHAQHSACITRQVPCL